MRYIKKLKTKPNIHLVRGHIVHQTLHKFHKTAVGPMPLGMLRKKLVGIFYELWEKNRCRLRALGISERRIAYFRDDSQRMLYHYSHWFYKRDMPVPDLTEARIYSPNLRSMGIIDAICESIPKPILIDYKTSRLPVVTEDMRRQAALYALLYHDRYRRTPGAVWIHFLTTPSDPVPLDVDKQLLDYGRVLINYVRGKTHSTNEAAYPCTCGGGCKKDFFKRN